MVDWISCIRELRLNIMTMNHIPELISILVRILLGFNIPIVLKFRLIEQT